MNNPTTNGNGFRHRGSGNGPQDKPNNRSRRKRRDGEGGADKEKDSQKSNWKRSFVNNNSNEEKNEDYDKDENEHCVICDIKIEIAIISECNHFTCHTCTFRHRALFKKQTCLICRNESNKNALVYEFNNINNEEEDISYENLANNHQPVEINERYHLSFLSITSSVKTLSLLKHVCGFDDCNEEFRTFKKLSEHVRKIHDLNYCFLCAIYKKAFTCELPLFTQSQLKIHMSKGDKSNGFNGHPSCEFCFNERFYSDDELKIHLREKHEKCHVCDLINPMKPNYFKNYEKLLIHFKNEHYMCPEESCLEQKFIVFEDEFNLKAHLIKEHPKLIGNNRNLTIQTPFLSVNNNNNNNNSNNNNNNSSKKNQSQLSTFNEDSLKIKKLRFEERARHYLLYSQEDFELFEEINKSFKNQEISPAIFWKNYKELFCQQSLMEIGLLVEEFLELLPKNLKEKLNDYTENILREEKNKTLYPVLGGNSNLNKEKAIWATGNRSHKIKRSNNEEKFPVLKGSSTNNNKPINNQVRYVTLTKKSNPKSNPVNKVNTGFTLNDSKANWASSSNNSSMSSINNSVEQLNLGPSLAEANQNNKPKPKINKTVKYTKAITTKQNGKIITKNVSGTNGSGMKIKLANRMVDNKLKITSHNNTNEENNEWVSSSGSVTPISSSPVDNNSENNSNNNGKKKKQKQILFRVGI